MKVLKPGNGEDLAVLATMLMHVLKKSSNGHSIPDPTFTEAGENPGQQNRDQVVLGVLSPGKEHSDSNAPPATSENLMPFLFLTTRGNTKVIDQVLKMNSHSYLAMPFTKEELFAAIEMLLRTHSPNYKEAKEAKQAKEAKEEEIALWHEQDFVFVKDGYVFRKIFFKEIVYLESEGNYVTLHLESQKKVMIRSTLKGFTDHFKQKMFVRVHRRYSVNKDKIENVFPSLITVNGYKIPLGKSYKEALYVLLGLTKN